MTKEIQPKTNLSQIRLIDKLLNKSKREIETGNLWRAKEIIRSSFGRFGFEPRLNAAYGKVLLAMKDDMQAGKFLFFGEPDPNKEEQTVINLFTQRHGKNEDYGLLAAAPMRYETKVSEYPEFILARLAQFHDMENPNIKDVKPKKSSSEIGGWFIFFLFALSVIIGFITIVKWLISLF